MEEGSGCLQGLAPADTLNGAYRAGYEQFTIRVMQSLYRQDARKGEGVFFSPASVYMALGMAAEGMKGETLEQTLTLLGAVSYTHLDVYKRQMLEYRTERMGGVNPGVYMLDADVHTRFYDESGHKIAWKDIEAGDTIRFQVVCGLLLETDPPQRMVYLPDIVVMKK